MTGMDEYAGHVEQYRLFVDTLHLMCGDLGMRFKDAKIDKAESPRGSTYHAHVEGQLTLGFLLDTFVQDNKIQETRVRVDIGYDKGSASFYEIADIGGHVNERGYLERWATRAIHNFNLEHNPVNLDALFGTVPMRVYGTYNDPILALEEMRLLLDGMQFATMDKPIIYRFRHVDGLMRTFSYCIFVSDGHASDFWAFFHNMGGLDSGGHSKSLKTIEDMIATNTAVDLKRVDIKYARLRKFLSERATMFNRAGRSTPSSYLSHVSGSFGAAFSESYSKFLDAHDNGEYSRALRDIRALLQMAMEEVCKQKEIDIPSKPTITKLHDRLVKHGILDGKTRAWYCAFLSIANLSARREFPTREDLLDQNTESRVKTTILLGTQLVQELDSVVNYAFYMGGRKFEYRYAIDAVKQIYERSLRADPYFLEKFDALEHNKRYGYISQDRTKLYPDTPLAVSKRVTEIPSAPGWWMRTNYGAEDVRRIAALAKKMIEQEMRHAMSGDTFGSNADITKRPESVELVTDDGLVIPQNENVENEFKSSFRYDYVAAEHEKNGKADLAQKQRKQVQKKNYGHGLEWDVAKAVAGFSNSVIEKGRVWVGIREGEGQTPEVLGLRKDMEESKSKNMDDDFGNWITDLLKNCIRGYASFDNVKISYPRIQGKQICMLEVTMASKAMYLFAKGDFENMDFFKRNNSAPRIESLRGDNLVKYVEFRFPSSTRQ